MYKISDFEAIWATMLSTQSSKLS